MITVQCIYLHSIPDTGGEKSGRRTKITETQQKTMIKKMTMLALTVCTLCATETQAQIKLGGKTLNAQKLVQAGADMIKAVTLSDADIAALSREAVEWMDNNNPVSPDTSAYSQRLKRLTENVKVDGLELNFKVYEVADVNAFACGDGSVRVFSSLMDLMDDRADGRDGTR